MPSVKKSLAWGRNLATQVHCSPFYRRELWASKSAGFNSTISLKIFGCKSWCPKDLRVCAVMCTRCTCANTFPDKSNLSHSHCFYLLKRMFPFNSNWHCAWFISWTLVIRQSKNLLTCCISTYSLPTLVSALIQFIWKFYELFFQRYLDSMTKWCTYINAEMIWYFLS